MLINPVVREMTSHEQVEYEFSNKGLMMEQGEQVYRLTAGTTDSVYVFKTPAVVLYVLTINHRYEYVAFDWYMESTDEPIDSILLQGHCAISECIGSDWRNISQKALAMRLLQLFE